MLAKEAILSRRSCRKYQTKDIPKEVIDNIILAGKSAPTAMNRQEIKFYVIHNNIKKIQSIQSKSYGKSSQSRKIWRMDGRIQKKYEVEDVIFYDSPCIIALTADKTGDERADYWHLMDAGIVTGNILTMATNYGLGTVPIGIANFLNQEAVLEGIGADKSKEHLLLVISLGYPVEGYKEKYVEDKPLTSFVKYA